MEATYHEPDVLDDLCPARQVLELIADKWSVLIVYALGEETRRYNQLQRMIGGITPKMLTQTLRRLERDGLVRRVVYPVVPPMVEYSLTPIGRNLLKLIAALCQWAEEHLADVQAARQTGGQSAS